LESARSFVLIFRLKKQQTVEDWRKIRVYELNNLHFSFNITGEITSNIQWTEYAAPMGTLGAQAQFNRIASRTYKYLENYEKM
jgi:hypothetical protein